SSTCTHPAVKRKATPARKRRRSSTRPRRPRRSPQARSGPRKRAGSNGVERPQRIRIAEPHWIFGYPDVLRLAPGVDIVVNIVFKTKKWMSPFWVQLPDRDRRTQQR